MFFSRRSRVDGEARKIEKLKSIDIQLSERHNSAHQNIGAETDSAAFERSIERRAERLGTTREALLTDYAQRIKESKYPTAYCLRAEEVQEIVRGRALLSSEELHLNHCEGCRSLLKAAEVSDAQIEELLGVVRQAVAEALPNRPNRSGSTLTGFGKLVSELKHSMPRWVPATSIGLLLLGLVYPSAEPYIKHPVDTYRLARARDERERQEARQRLVAQWGLDKLAGHLPKDPSEVQETVDRITAASVRGVLKKPDDIARRRQEMQQLAKSAEPNDRNQWLNYTLELASAETMARYEILREHSPTAISVRDLMVSDVSVRNGIPSVVVDSKRAAVDNPQVEALMRESFRQTDGISAFNVYRKNGYRKNDLVYSFRRQ